MEARIRAEIEKRNIKGIVDLFREVNGDANTEQYAFNQAMLDTYFNDIHEAELVNPGAVPGVGAAAAVTALYKLQSDHYKEHAGRMNTFRSYIIANMTDGLEEIIGQGVLSLTSLSLRVILGRLDVEFRQRNPIREAVLDAIIESTIKEEETFVEFSGKIAKAYRERQQSDGIVVAPGIRLKGLIKGITDQKTGKWLHGRETVQEIWNANNPTWETRTIASLTAALKAHDESKPKEKNAGEQFAGAAKSREDKDEIMHIKKSDINKMVEDAVKARMGSNNNGGGGGGWNQRKDRGNGGGAGGGIQGAGGQRKPRNFFCSSHAWNVSHNSRDCMQKQPGHRDEETEAERRIRCPNDRRNNR